MVALLEESAFANSKGELQLVQYRTVTGGEFVDVRISCCRLLIERKKLVGRRGNCASRESRIH